MSARTFAAFFALTTVCVQLGFAQSLPAIPVTIPLTVPAGVPLQVALEKSVTIKKSGVPVAGHLVEPVYVFDRVVIPAGSRILGRVSKVEAVPRMQRARAIVNGDFTPLRKAQVEFSTLLLPDGRRIALHTVVSPGSAKVVHLTAGGKRKGTSRVGGAVSQAQQQARQRVHDTLQQIKAPGKMQRLKQQLKTMATAELPYHRQSFAAGTHFTAELSSPLQLGVARCPAQELAQLGADIPAGSSVHVRLLKGLSSATDRKGEPVQAVVSQPVFSPDHHLILPEGARLDGFLTQAQPARRLGRNGKLRFTFKKIEMPEGESRKIEASLQAADVAGGDHVQLDEEGGAHAVTPKTHFIAPAIDVVLATSSLDGLDGHHRDIANGTRGPDTAGGAIRGGAGFGLAGTIVGLVAHSRPVSSGFAFYGAAWSVYSHIVARGTDVTFPKNTPMEIAFGSHEAPARP